MFDYKDFKLEVDTRCVFCEMIVHYIKFRQDDIERYRNMRKDALKDCEEWESWDFWEVESIQIAEGQIKIAEQVIDEIMSKLKVDKG